MPSDPTRGVQQLLADRGDSFRSALARALEELRTLLNTSPLNAEDHAERTALELGPFAAGRIDFARFAHLSRSPSTANGSRGLDPEPLVLALDTLRRLHDEGPELVHVEVREGESLEATVEATLAHLGTAFGAARVVALAKSGRYEPAEHNRLLESFPFARWSARERMLAPPLVVGVRGSALRAAGLEAFLDGAQKLVLIVDGDCAPAPLVRLITPRTYVVQTSGGKELEGFAAWSGPGIAALVPPTAARFAHDPEGGSTLGARLRLDHLPETVAAVGGGWSAAQLEAELGQLAALGALPPEVSPAAEPQPVAGPDPVDRLAAWLLRQADPPPATKAEAG